MWVGGEKSVSLSLSLSVIIFPVPHVAPVTIYPVSLETSVICWWTTILKGLLLPRWLTTGPPYISPITLRSVRASYAFEAQARPTASAPITHSTARSISLLEHKIPRWNICNTIYHDATHIIMLRLFSDTINKQLHAHNTLQCVSTGWWLKIYSVWLLSEAPGSLAVDWLSRMHNHWADTIVWSGGYSMGSTRSCL